MKKASNKHIALRENPILLGFAVQKKSLDGRIQIRFRWGRLFVTFLLTAVAGWFSLGGALYFYFKYTKEFEDVSYTKMLTLFPFGLDEHRREMGDYHIDKGLDQIAEGKYRDGFRLLRLGIARSPGNLQGRMVLAEFYEIAIKRADIAAQQLIEGLEQGGLEDLDYLKQTLRVLLRHQLDEEIQAIADQQLPEEPELTDRNRVLAFGAANANYLRGNFDRAENYLIGYGLIDSLEGLLLSSQISWGRGDKVAAITKMEASLGKFPNSEPLLLQLSRYHRELENLDDARRYAILRNVSAPLSAAPRLELLYIYNKAGDEESEQRETQRMLKQFRDDENALQALGNFAAETGNINLARRTYEEALENEFAIDSFALLLIEAHLSSKDFKGALYFAEELLKEQPDWLSDRWATFNSLRAVASYGVDQPDLGEIYLQDFLNGKNTQSETFLAVARYFSTINRVPQARRILLEAYQRNPSNQRILSELIRTELRLGYTENLNRLLPRLLQMRRPQEELLVEAYRKLGSDRFIFTPNREGLLLELSAMLRRNTQFPVLDT
ncbi:MAG: tetratricopeptide repeat protein [Opitutales bacterium]